MAIPTFADYGAPEIAYGVGSSNAQRTPAMPGHTAGAVMLCFVCGDGNPPTLQTANGWQLGVDLAGNQASSAIAGQCSIRIYWKRATSASELAPVINDPSVDGNTCGCSHINRYTDVRASGTPFHKIVTATVTTPTAAIDPPPITTTIADCMIGAVAASAENDSLFQSWGGTGVSNFSIDSGFNTSIGNDCSWAGGRGGIATPGTGSLESDFQTATQQAQISFALASLTEGAADANLTLTSATVTSTGILEIQGTANLTPSDFTVTAQQNEQPIVGTSTLTIDATTVSSAGTLSIQGSAALTLDTVSVSAQEGTALSIGNSTVKQRINAAQPTSGTFTTDPISTETGSLLVACVMRGKWTNAAAPVGPTDSQGNTWTALHDFAYATFPDSRAGIWYCINNGGSPTHTFSLTFGSDNAGGGDEVTISVVELKGVSVLQASSHVERTAAASVSGVSVTPTGPSICLSWICGNGPVGITHVFTPDSASAAAGWAVNSGASATGDPSNNGYIQVTLTALVDSSGTKVGQSQNCTHQNLSVNEGGQIFQQVFQVELGQLGESALTIGAFTTTAAGGLTPLTADSNQTISDLTVSSSGQLEISGSSNLTLDTVSVTASGQQVQIETEGSANLTLDIATIQSTGEVLIQGTSISNVDNFNTQSTGTVALGGSLVATVDDFSLTAASIIAITGLLDTTVINFTVDASGTSELFPLSGDASLTVSNISTNAFGELDITGSASLLISMTVVARGDDGVPDPVRFQIPVFKSIKVMNVRPSIKRRK